MNKPTLISKSIFNVEALMSHQLVLHSVYENKKPIIIDHVCNQGSEREECRDGHENFFVVFLTIYNISM